MDEILQQLLNNDLLSESTRTQITEQWASSVKQLKKSLREEVETDVRAELAAAWTTEREQLLDTLDKFMAESLEKELSELRADVERFRDHEAEQAAKIVEMRKSMAKTLGAEMEELVENLDRFLSKELKRELTELREDLEIARQNHLGNKIFEAFRSTYETSFVDSKSTQARLNATAVKLRESQAEVQRLQREKEAVLRESKMQEVLQPLSGSAREQMALILKSVPTEQLAESYKRFIGRVLQEGSTQRATQTALSESTTVKTGGEPLQPTVVPKQSDALTEMKRIAGIIR